MEDPGSFESWLIPLLSDFVGAFFPTLDDMPLGRGATTLR